MKLHVRYGAGPALMMAWLSVTPGMTAAATTPDGRGEYGVMLAMSGQPSKAESIFVSMLTNVRGDARALNNLGNLRVLRGDLGVALAFYDRALRGDSTDAGIHLNRATALMLMGDETRAESAAAQGVRLAGGLDQAQRLLGLKTEKETAKASDKAYVNRDEIRALLKRATAAVPTDTTGASHHKEEPAPGKKKPPTWRSAGPRATDDSEAGQILYWKR